MCNVVNETWNLTQPFSISFMKPALCLYISAMSFSWTFMSFFVELKWPYHNKLLNIILLQVVYYFSQNIQCVIVVNINQTTPCSVIVSLLIMQCHLWWHFIFRQCHDRFSCSWYISFVIVIRIWYYFSILGNVWSYVIVCDVIVWSMQQQKRTQNQHAVILGALGVL